MEVIASDGLSISDAAELAGISAHTLRYYERASLLEPVQRAASGHRRFAPADLDRVRFIGYLRQTGMPIRRIREYFELVREGEQTEPQRLALLEAHRKTVLTQVREARENLAAIDRKIQIYTEGSNC